MSVIKRFFFYAVSLISLGMLSGGAALIITLLVDIFTDRGATSVGRGQFNAETFSMGLALAVIGGVLWAFFWRYIQKHTANDIEEQGSAIRAWYLNLVLFFALSTFISAAVEFLAGLVNGFNEYDYIADWVGRLIIAAAVWYYHHRVQAKEGQPSSAAKTLRRWYLYIFSVWGLAYLSIGLVQLIYRAVVWLPIWGDTTRVVSGIELGFAAGFGITGAFVWWLHWFRLAKGDIQSTLRQVYLYLFAILGSVIAGLTALVTTIYQLLRYALGGAPGATPVYFQFLGWTIPLLLVAATIWLYHRQVARDEAALMPSVRSSARRVYSYLMSLAGLGGLVAGIIVLIGLLLRLLIAALSTSAVAGTGGGFWQSFLSLAIALLAVGAPMWYYYWGRVNKMVAAGGIEERRALTRRFYLYFLLAAGVVAAATGLSAIIYQLLSSILQGNFGVTFLRESIWGWQCLLVALPFLFYHWSVLRADQKLGAEVTVTQKKAVTLLTTPENTALLYEKIEAKFGHKPRLLRYQPASGETIPLLTDAEVEKIIAGIETAAGGRLLLVVNGKGWQVFPYEER